MPSSPHSFRRSAPSLRLEPRPSRLGLLALGVIALLAVLALIRSALPWPWLVPGLALVIAVAWPAARQMRYPPISAAALQADGGWLLTTAAGDSPARLIDYQLLAGLIGVQFRSLDGQQCWHCLWWPDSLAPEPRRWLAVWLRSGRAAAARRDPLLGDHSG